MYVVVSRNLGFMLPKVCDQSNRGFWYPRKPMQLSYLGFMLPQAIQSKQRRIYVTQGIQSNQRTVGWYPRYLIKTNLRCVTQRHAMTEYHGQRFHKRLRQYIVVVSRNLGFMLPKICKQSNLGFWYPRKPIQLSNLGFMLPQAIQSKQRRVYVTQGIQSNQRTVVLYPRYLFKLT